MQDKASGSFYDYVLARIMSGVALFCFLMAVMAWGATETVADRFIEQRLVLVMEQMMKDSQISQQLMMRNDGPWHSWLASSASLPDHLMSLRKPGIYELMHPDVHVVAATSPLNGELVFLQYTPDLDPEQLDYTASARWILLAAIVLVLILGTILARVLAAKITEPVLELKARVDKASAQSPPDPLDRNDEIGALSQSFFQSFSRVSQFIEREKQFTRYASHELRTPVTVIQGALDVMEHLSLPENSHPVLKRIRLANQDMQALIDTFLALGREDNLRFQQSQRDKHTSLLSLSDLVLDRFHNVRPDIQVLRYRMFSDHCVPEQAASIVIQNLLRNAYSYGDSELRIGLRNQFLLISNDLPDSHGQNSAQSAGYGLGHEIVARLCACYGWTMTTHQKEKRYRAVIDFSS